MNFANFYRRFIKYYPKITTPLTALTCKDNMLLWDSKIQAAFDTLKTAFSFAPVLIYFDPAIPFIVDALDFALRVILSQFVPDGSLHLVVFYSKKLISAKMND